MKAKDLMIGDWVKVICPKHESCERVKDIHSCDAAPYIKVEDEDKWYLSEVEPIPLTPEILEKNGFEIYEQDFTSNPIYKFGCFDYMEYEEYHKYFDIGCRMTYTHFGVDSTYIHSMMRIQYVHELQHALRLCGINLEIKI